MIPISDLNPTQRKPVVNTLLIVLNIAAFLWEYSLIVGGAPWVIPGYGVVPRRVVADPLGEAFTVVTSMFMHGGWGHLGGNMLFLYIFGDNVEDAIGRGRYALFYAVCGFGAALAQIMIDPTSAVPMVGASGAIAGVLGAYLVLYPRAPVTVLNPIPPLWFLLGLFIVFPAWLVVGEWFLWQLLSGVGSLGAEVGGGVAFFAHIGGFIAGLLLIRPAMAGRRKAPSSRWHGWQPPPGSREDRWHPPKADRWDRWQ
jgi:membrane associated rhomboid family serine protease